VGETYLWCIFLNLFDFITGSETSSTTLSNVFYYLLTHPKAVEKLRTEIDSEFPLDAEIEAGMALNNMRYLNAVM